MANRRKPLADPDADLLIQKIRLLRAVSQSIGDPLAAVDPQAGAMDDDDRRAVIGLIDEISLLVARLEARKADVAALMLAANDGNRASSAYAKAARVAAGDPIPLFPRRARI